MTDNEVNGSPGPSPEQQAGPLEKADARYPFGPSFFLGQLERFVRDHCPSPEEHLPHVQLKLVDGETLDLCHVVGVSSKWVVLAVLDPGAHGHEMTTALVPFEMVQGVRIRAHHQTGATAGFAQTQQPAAISAEMLVEAAFGRARKDPPPAGGDSRQEL